MAKLERSNFSKAVTRIIFERAGSHCSLPTCGQIAMGPSGQTQHSANIGVAAHIFSASPKGPRGQGGLSDKELALPENGIWLCANHARLIDVNKGNAYPAEIRRLP